MILLFLQDWRSVLVVVANIPLALMGSSFGLWASQNTINIMSLGGMALRSAFWSTRPPSRLKTLTSRCNKPRGSPPR